MHRHVPQRIAFTETGSALPDRGRTRRRAHVRRADAI